MNSKLELESKLGIGSTFSFHLNVKYSNEDKKNETKKDKNETQKPFQVIVSNENIIVFLVEDNKINMLLAKTLITQILPNVSIFEFENGKEVVKKASELKPDLILMDIQMPEMNGYEATAEIRKIANLEQTPIIALTAGTIVGEKEKCIEAGMNDYITKPIDRENLKNIISNWILKV